MPKLLLAAAIAWPLFCYTPAMENQARPPDKTEGALILQAVCGAAAHVEDSAQGPQMYCNPCPDFTSLHGLTMQKFHLRWIIQGAFTAPGAQDLAAFFEGCEPLSDNFSGAVLLNKQGDGWKMGRYESSLRPLAVRTVRLAAGRDVIIAEGNRIGLGLDNNSLYTYDFTREFGARHTLLSVSDTTRACEKEITKASLDKVTWQDQNFSAVVTWGRMPATPDYLRYCPDKIPPVPTQTYTLNFTFDGSAFQAAPDSAATLKQIEGR